MSGTEGTGKGSEKKKNASIIVIAILAVVIIVLVVFLIKRGDAPDKRDVSNSTRVILDEDSAQSTMDEMREEVEEGMFECSMSTEWTFSDGTSTSKDAYIANSSNNTHPFYFDVVLDGSEETIYSSPVIPVGSQITDIQLDKDLDAGTYKAICKYVLLKDEESQEELSTANFVVTITVQN